MGRPLFACPYCHRPLMSADEACSGSLAEPDHPALVKAVPSGEAPDRDVGGVSPSLEQAADEGMGC